MQLMPIFIEHVTLVHFEVPKTALAREDIVVSKGITLIFTVGITLRIRVTLPDGMSAQGLTCRRSTAGPPGGDLALPGGRACH
jgi:hypothetical protein